MSYFPKNLKYLRKTAHLSQEQLATEIGLNRGNIASYEKGSALPSIKKMIEISRLFNVDLIDLYEKKLDGIPMYKGKDGHLHSISQLTGKKEMGPQQYNSDHPVTNEKLKENIDTFRLAFKQFKEINQNEASSFNLISQEINRLSLNYGHLIDIVEQVLETNAVLLEQLDKTAIKADPELV